MMSGGKVHSQNTDLCGQITDLSSSHSEPHIQTMLQTILQCLQNVELRMSKLEQNQQELFKENEKIINLIQLSQADEHSYQNRLTKNSYLTNGVPQPEHYDDNGRVSNDLLEGSESNDVSMNTNSNANILRKDRFASDQNGAATQSSGIVDENKVISQNAKTLAAKSKCHKNTSAALGSMVSPAAMVTVSSNPQTMTESKLVKPNQNDKGGIDLFKGIEDHIDEQEEREEQDLVSKVEAYILPESIELYGNTPVDSYDTITSESGTFQSTDNSKIVTPSSREDTKIVESHPDYSYTEQTIAKCIDYENSSAFNVRSYDGETLLKEAYHTSFSSAQNGFPIEGRVVPLQAQPLCSANSASISGPEMSDDETYGMSEVGQLLEEESEKRNLQESQEITISERQTSSNQVDPEGDRMQKCWVDLIKVDVEHIKHLFPEAYLQNSTRSTRDLLQAIKRYDQAHLYQALWKAIAGIKPDLYFKAFGYPPVKEDRDFIISEFAGKFKTIIKETKSSRADKIGDRSIMLDQDYIKLRGFGENTKQTSKRPSRKATNYHSSDEDSDDEDSDDDDEPQEKAREELMAEEEDGDFPHLHQERDDVKEKPVEDLLIEYGLPRHTVMIMIKGRPGVGKTTTIQWLHRQWSLGEFAENFTLFLVIHIRYLIHIRDQEMSLKELLSQHTHAVRMAGGLPGCFELWLENNESRVLLAIDGIDEMPDFGGHFNYACEVTSIRERAKPFDLLVNILKRKLLPSSSVILLSRSFTLLKEIPFDKLVEIKGLTKEGVFTYIRKFSPPDKVKDITALLDRSPILMSVCSVTVYCMLLCSSMVHDATLPDQDLQTYTRIYSFIIMHYLRRSDSLGGLRDGDSVGIRYAELLRSLSSLAETSFNHRPIQMIFTGHDLQSADVNLQEVVRTGLMTVETDVDQDGRSPEEQRTIASYLHLSIQEFLSSAMLTQKRPQDLLTYISNELEKGQFEMALLFCFGQVFDRKSRNIKQVHEALQKNNNAVHPSMWSAKEDKLTEIFKSILESADGDEGVRLAVLAHESQDPRLAGLCAAGLTEDGTIDFSGSLMTVVDMMSVMFVLKHAKKTKELWIERCGLDSVCIPLMEDFLTSTKTLKRLHLAENDLQDEGTVQLVNILQGNISVKHLSLSFNKIADQGVLALAKYIENSKSLKILEIDGNRFGDEALECLVRAILKKSSLQKLDISGNRRITNRSVACLKALLEHLPNGFTLRMKNGGLTSAGIYELERFSDYSERDHTFTQRMS